MKRSCSSALVAILTACFDRIAFAWSLYSSSNPQIRTPPMNRGKRETWRDRAAAGGFGSTHLPADVRGGVGRRRRGRHIVLHHLRRRHPREPSRRTQLATSPSFLSRRRKSLFSLRHLLLSFLLFPFFIALVVLFLSF